MDSAAYTALRRRALAEGLWFIWPESGRFRGWVVPPGGVSQSFQLTIDDRRVSLRPVDIKGLSALFLRAGMANADGFTFEFDFEPRLDFPKQHVVRVEFRDNPSRLLPHYICRPELDSLPPAANSFRTTHITNPAIFFHTGQNDCGRLLSIFAKHGIGNHPLILDWGCGCGRISTFMTRRFGNERVFGVDVDPVNIEWLKSYFGSQYNLIDFSPRLPFADQTFDAVYGISVMTHLGELQQQEWLRELSRVISPGGILVLTFHSMAHFFADVNDISLCDRLIANGFIDCGRNEDLDEGFPASKERELYRNVFNTEDHAMRLCLTQFSIIDHLPGAMRTQDILVLRR